ncbi:helix-turn-helix domain-containing protein [Metabacillus sp. 84]|uniref:helix-turn-helix domain-containing protein n=1 Tax=Metabacillus sp. 84 TaxID=3404705 RepID=UPI003CF6DCD5
MNLTAQEFADFIRHHRLSIHMSRKQFAEELGVKKITYDQWEQGRNLAKDAPHVISSVRQVVKKNIRRQGVHS